MSQKLTCIKYLGKSGGIFISGSMRWSIFALILPYIILISLPNEKPAIASNILDTIFSEFEPSGPVNDWTPDCSVKVQNNDYGLKVSSAKYHFSRDGGFNWLPFILEDFNNGADNWLPDSYGTWTTELIQGNLHYKAVINQGVPKTISILKGIENFGDFDVSVTCYGLAEMFIMPSPGIVFRYQDENNYYYFVVRDEPMNNRCILGKVVDGVEQELRSERANVDERRNIVLKVQTKGPFITCWVEGTLKIDSLQDGSFNYGSCGVILREEPTMLSARTSYFNDFKIDNVWIKADHCTGVDGTREKETITVLSVPFNQASPLLNKIQFKINNMIGDEKESQVFNVHITNIATFTPTQAPPTETPTNSPTPSPLHSFTPTNTPTATPTLTPTPTKTAGTPKPLPPPKLNEEPPFTKGLSNVITWTPVESEFPVYYLAQSSLDYFLTIYSQSPVLESTYYKFTNLLDGREFFYRVKAGDSSGAMSPWSNVVSSTQDNSPPIIAAGGYMDTAVSTQSGGRLNLQAVVINYPPLSPIVSCEVLFQGYPTNIYLNDKGEFGDQTANDSIYTFQANIPPGAPPGEYLLSIIATDGVDNFSSMFPYLCVKSTSKSKETSLLQFDQRAMNFDWFREFDRTVNKGSFNGPRINLAGYLYTDLSEQEGGFINLIAWVTPRHGTHIIRVELLVNHISTGVVLRDDGLEGDFKAGDTVYTLYIGDIPPGVPSNYYLLEIVAYDNLGGRSNVWPYFTIEDVQVNTPPTAVIYSPQDGAIYPPGTAIDFSGAGFDKEDGELSGSSLQWYSSRDGFLGTGKSFSRTLSSGGHYINLQAYDSMGAVGSDYVTITVGTPAPTDPIAHASANPTSGSAPLTVYFYGSAERGTPPYTFSWDFGDGSPTSNQQNPVHTYTAVGTYTAVLTVIDSASRRAFDSVIINVGNNPPTAKINSPADGSVFNYGDTVVFQGSGYDPEDGQLQGASLQWSSSINGSLGSGTTISVNNLNIGTHIITLTAIDSLGATATDSISIAIQQTSEHITCNNITYPSYGTVRSTVCLVNVVRGDVVRWDWYLLVGGNLIFYDTFSDTLNQSYSYVEVWSQLVGQPPGTEGEVRVFFNNQEATGYRRSFTIP